MSLTPTDGPEVRDSDGRVERSVRSKPQLTGRARIRAWAVGVQRDVAQGKRSIRATVRSGLDRLLSPGLAAADQESLADDTVIPSRCPSISSLPARAFPLTYPTRAYRLVENDADLVADVGDGTFRLYHPDGSETWLRSDTWTQLEQ
jgi:hypothetical protein